MADFTKLKIWQNAHELTLRVYKLSSKLPKEEVFNLVSQMRRAAISVESNIAEGESRYSSKDKLNFFVQSRSSSAELQTQLLLVSDLYHYVSNEALGLKIEYERLNQQINSLIRYRKTTDYGKS